MKLKITFLSLIVMLCSVLSLRAQVKDTIPDLIISEVQLYGNGYVYVELTNRGDSTLDLSKFALEKFRKFRQYWFIDVEYGISHLPLEGTLEPGKSLVISAVLDEVTGSGLKDYRPKLAAASDILIYPKESMPAEEDSVSAVAEALMTVFNAEAAYVIRYYPTEDDSIVIDAVNHSMNTEDFRWGGNLPVAGVDEAALTHILVRKYSVKQGTPLQNYESNWDAARGSDIASSEWLPIPHKGEDPEGIIYRTVGNHGDFHIDVTPAIPGISIDLNAPAMTIPWGIYKGDSIIDFLTLGDGMSWWFTEAPSVADSAYTICRTGDILTLYACGNTLEQKDFTLTVSPPAANMAKVFPKRLQVINEDNPNGYWVTPYYVTDDEPVIDTIGNVPFALRKDTLFKYLDKAPNAQWSIIWVDGNERLDLMNGDILKVVAEDGTTEKQYFIDVQEYGASSNTDLAAITWPDINLDQAWRLDQGWLNGDTIPGFSSVIGSYNISLPYGTRQVPVLTAIPANANAQIKVKRATSLSGGFDERTTTFMVTAEDDSTVAEYKVLFTVMRPTELTQPLYADPFISEIIVRWGNRTSWVELYNPGNQPLDLSQYMLVLNNNTPVPDVIKYDSVFDNRYFCYVPGFKFTDDTSKYENNGRYLELDAIDPVINPGETFLVAAWLNESDAEESDWAKQISDIYFDELEPNHWGQTYNRGAAVGYHMSMVNAEMLYRIENDSILDGRKPIGDPADFTLIDVFGTYDGAPWSVAGISCVIGGKTRTNGWRYIRKPQFWHGNTDNLASFGTGTSDSEWWVRTTRLDADSVTISGGQLVNNLGAHVMDPVTAHISSISSLVYIVSDGYSGENLSIIGISNGETVQAFFNNLIKADPGQSLVVTSATDGSVKNSDAAIAENDILTVTSANQENVTKYALTITPIDANTNLVAASGSGLVVDNSAATISGFAYGATIKSITDKISTQSNTSIYNVVDSDTIPVPLSIARADGGYNNTVAGANIRFEVIAQNGDVKLFSLVPDSKSSDAYVISDVFVVNNDRDVITMIPGGLSVMTFMASVEVVEGATATIQDMAGNERIFGTVKYDDYLVVVSEDKSFTRTYNLAFLDELVINSAPLITLASSDITVFEGVSTKFSATVSDDGYPLGSSYSYKWELISGDAGSVSIASPNTLTTNIIFSAVGSYSISLEVSDGELSSTATVYVTVEKGTGINDLKATQVKMFPNPAKERVTIQLEDMNLNSTTVGIIDLSGRTVFMMKPVEGTMDIDLSGFEAGIYYVTVKSGDFKLNQKLCIVK